MSLVVVYICAGGIGNDSKRRDDGGEGRNSVAQQTFRLTKRVQAGGNWGRPDS